MYALHITYVSRILTPEDGQAKLKVLNTAVLPRPAPMAKIQEKPLTWWMQFFSFVASGFRANPTSAATKADLVQEIKELKAEAAKVAGIPTTWGRLDLPEALERNQFPPWVAEVLKLGEFRIGWLNSAYVRNFEYVEEAQACDVVTRQALLAAAGQEPSKLEELSRLDFKIFDNDPELETERIAEY